MDQQCLECDGIGYVCSYCGYPDKDCICEDGPEVVPCSWCGGTGDYEEAE